MVNQHKAENPCGSGYAITNYSQNIQRGKHKNSEQSNEKTREGISNAAKISSSRLRLIENHCLLGHIIQWNPDSASQVGYLIFLADKNNNANLIDYSSIKSRRLVRSVQRRELWISCCM